MDKPLNIVHAQGAHIDMAIQHEVPTQTSEQTKQVTKPRDRYYYSPTGRKVLGIVGGAMLAVSLAGCQPLGQPPVVNLPTPSAMDNGTNPSSGTGDTSTAPDTSSLPSTAPETQPSQAVVQTQPSQPSQAAPSDTSGNTSISGNITQTPTNLAEFDATVLAAGYKPLKQVGVDESKIGLTGNYWSAFGHVLTDDALNSGVARTLCNNEITGVFYNISNQNLANLWAVRPASSNGSGPTGKSLPPCE